MKNIAFFIILGTVTVFSACHSKQEKPKASPEEESTGQFIDRVRPAASGGTSAAYFTYKNTLDVADTLKSVSTSFAGMSQVHESYKTEDGMMGMREQKNVVINPGQNLTFKQGGLHIMLMSLNKELAAGDSVTVEMEWAKAGVIAKQLPVQP